MAKDNIPSPAKYKGVMVSSMLTAAEMKSFNAFTQRRPRWHNV